MTIKRIKNRILRKGRGAVFTPSTFLDLGTRANVDQALSRLTKSGFIRRLTRGIYDYPKFHKFFGTLSPTPYDIAKAGAEGGGYKLLINSDVAANYFGLSTQVPAKPVYLTDGPTRTYKIGKMVIKVIHVSASKMVGAGRASGFVFQGLRYLGKNRVNELDLKQIASLLSDQDKQIVWKDSFNLPAWMQKSIKRIVEVY